MLIVADENIPFAREAFGTLGEVRLAHGRALDRAAVRDAEILLVRSITRVDAGLLEGTAVRFVGTATIGTDHINHDYLQQRGITFASAAGCNANAVAEYVIAALVHLAHLGRLDLQRATLGVVGVGNVGSRVAVKAHALGMRLLLNDPPWARELAGETDADPTTGTRSRPATTEARQRNLALLAQAGLVASDQKPLLLPLEALMDAGVITLHTPLTRQGPEATHHLFDAARLQAMAAGSILINTSRGEVVASNALKTALQQGKLSAAVLDVWEGEAHIDAELAQMVALGTPHVAGYSLEGKLQGTLLIYNALCRFLRRTPGWDHTRVSPPVTNPTLSLSAGRSGLIPALQQAIRHAYDLAADDAAFRRAMDPAKTTAEQRSRHFDRLRKTYPMRREFHNYTMRWEGDTQGGSAILRALGFQVEE